MKLKKLLSGVTAAVMALSSLAVASFTTASAADSIHSTGTFDSAKAQLILVDWSSSLNVGSTTDLYVAFDVTTTKSTSAYLGFSSNNGQGWNADENGNPATAIPSNGRYVVKYSGAAISTFTWLGVIFSDYQVVTDASVVGVYTEDPSEDLGITGSDVIDPDVPDQNEDSKVIYDESFTTGSRENTLYLEASNFEGSVSAITITSKIDPASADTWNTTLQVATGNVSIDSEAGPESTIYNEYIGGESTREDTITITTANDLSKGLSIGGYNLVITSVAVTYGEIDTPEPTPAPTPSTGYDAFLMFGGSDWDSWGNWDPASAGGFGNDAVISGDGTYTVSISADTINGEVSYDEANHVYTKTNPNNNNCFDYETGAAKPYLGGAPQVFCVDIVDLLKDYNESNVTCSVESIKQDGVDLEFDPSKILYGNLEDDNDKYRIEIYNPGGDGDTADDPAFDPFDIAFSDSLAVTFKIGLKKTTANVPSTNNVANPTTNKPTAATKVTRSPEAVAKDKAAAQKAMKQAKIKKLTVKSKAKKKITVTWKKVKKAKGYEVEVNKNKKFKKGKKVLSKLTSKKKLVIKNKKIKSGKKYYVRVRAYATYKNANNVSIKVYSKWNKQLRTVKVK